MASFTNTGFDPLFGDPLQQLIERAKAQGIDASIISGVRSDEDQRQLVANAAATRAGRPLPYPERGPVPMAAPVGQSAHEYGLAADVKARDPADQPKLWEIGRQLGLEPLGPSDPTHFQARNWQSTAGGQAAPTPWADVPNVPSAYAENAASPSAPASAAITQAAPAPGITLNSGPMGVVAGAESGGRNIPQQIHDVNTDRGTPASGYFQIIDPTWRRYAPAVGVDTKQFPSAMSAPLGVQGQVASAIPINQWGPNTVSALKQAFPGINTQQTLGEAQAKFGQGPGPGNVGPVTGFLPGAPTGRGGIGSDAAAAPDAAAAAKPNLADQLVGSLKPLQDALKPEQQPQQGADPGAQALAQEMQAGMAAQQIQQARMAQFAPMMAMLQQKGAQPVHWGSAPPGFGIAGGLIQPPGMPTPTPGGGQIGGTTLNSMGDFGYG